MSAWLLIYTKKITLLKLKCNRLCGTAKRVKGDNESCCTQAAARVGDVRQKR